MEYLSNMRGHVNIQVHNIMAVESDGNTGNGTLFHNGIAAVIDAFKVVGHYSNS